MEGVDGWNAEHIALPEHLTPREQVAEAAQARGTLIQQLKSLGDAIPYRPQPWPGWEGTPADDSRAVVCPHGCEHRGHLRALARTLQEE